ncbi:MAG TPA: HlyD family efflux transporter periplasmic adaptor subunit [Candidatus Polarisedimenticolaceae bacterium]|nr:HlyD family efflux transporter periplasmic adaptor subunit [Candidatus Polarisedimenticolaceae bacterium]
MDVARPRKKRYLARGLTVGAGVGILGAVTVGLYGISSPPPTVVRSAVWIDTVRRGPMVIEVRGAGTLAPEQVRWIVADTAGRVEARLLDAGAAVAADTVLVELRNPELELAAQQALLELRAAEAETQSLRVALEHELLDQEALAATVEADWRQAQLEVESNEELAKDGLVPQLTLKIARVRADELALRRGLEHRRLASAERATAARLAAQQARVDQLAAVAALRRREVAGLEVRAGTAGVLQDIPVEPGQSVAAGAVIARVAEPERLEARLLIPQSQASEVQLGQPATIDTRNGSVSGSVVRIDPAVRNGTVTVDVTLEGELPRGARPDLTVNGTITIEHLTDVLHVGRPAFAPAGEPVGLFRLVPETNDAERVEVVFGRSSVRLAEVVSGLAEGDQVILSDVPGLGDAKTVRLQ